jgi:hypothetical protein
VVSWLKHAFAIPQAAEFLPSESERRLVEQLRRELECRHLLLPASVLLESFRPLGFVASQSIWVAYPWFASVMDAAGLKVLGQMLERPGSVDWILDQFSQTSVPETDVCPAEDSAATGNSAATRN